MSEVPEQVAIAVAEEGDDGLRGGFSGQLSRDFAACVDSEQVGCEVGDGNRVATILQGIHPEVERVVELGQRAVEQVVGTRVADGVSGGVKPVEEGVGARR
jgi:hypothetical protein